MSRPSSTPRSFTRRSLLATTLAAPAIVLAARLGSAADRRVLKISHQFPGGTLEQGDFRDRLCRLFAKEVEAKSGGTLGFEIYPGSSLMKTNAQFSALRKGALDLSFYPLPYAGGEVPETNIGLMPALITSYDNGQAWRAAPIGKALDALMIDKGIRMLTWIWQAGGVASRSSAVIRPADAKGLKIRGGSREMDMMLKAAGASVSAIPSNEIYAGMQTGVMDAAVTSSTSLISFKIEELSKNLTTARVKSFWFMLEPLMMSQSVFASLTPDQQAILADVGSAMEKFGYEAAKADDQSIVQVYGKAGSAIHDMDAAALEQWRAIARETAWKDFAERVKDGAQWLKMAEAVA